MIKFACVCHKILNVTDDRAGSSMQCPFCGKLVDVPLLSDLANIGEDGTYNVGPDEQREVHKLAEMQRVYSRQRTDELGRDIDLRPGERDFANLGEPETLQFADDPEAEAAEARLAAPKYDPVTGELVRPIDIQQTDHAPTAALPVAKAMVGYASPKLEAAADFHPGRIIPEMFKFTNLTVMLVIFCAHIFLQMTTFPLMGGFFLLTPVFFIMGALLMAHYAVIVEDIGVEQQDELPRPLRNFAWHEDMWGPFVQFASSLLLCYGGIIALNWTPPILALPLFASVMIFGTIAFPAVLLTQTTSGTYLNLSPDRLLRVISELGMSYVLCVILWAIASVTYIFGIIASMLAVLKLFVPPAPGQWYLNIPVTIGYPALLTGIFVMHGFTWYLGLMYRQHHPHFNWAYQHHVRTVKPRRIQHAAARPLPAKPVRPGPGGQAGPHA
jgi:hypothetical protein